MLESDLLNVEKPSRYLGGEPGSRRKKSTEIRFVLAFPDVYEVGMSYLGFQILYGVLNEAEWLSAERVYTPWPDMEALLRDKGEPLSTLESGLPLKEADIIGFTLQYELSYTNILNMLELAKIPLQASERDERYPLILGGGPCASNPEPISEFFDAFLLGDGEEAAMEIAQVHKEWKRAKGKKEELFDRLTAIEGVYVPSFFKVGYDPLGRIESLTPLKKGYEKVKRRLVVDLNDAFFPESPVVPFLKTVHDRISMEIARGCTRGCRFCQAGYIYRPVRERSPERVLDTIERNLAGTGYDEVSLLSLSTGDYGCISPLIKTLMERYAKRRVAVSFPSLRVGTLTRELMEEVKKVRKTGFTLAPEVASERLRRVINKEISEDELLETVAEVFSAGWRLIKLYFMIGLPTETVEDVVAIADLSKKVKNTGKGAGGGEVNVAVSSFVPKPNTPFQWEPQISYEEILEKQEILRREFKKKKINFKWQEASMSVMEGVFARGDRQLAKVLIKAHELGCRFDGWGEHFSFAGWREAFRAVGIDPLFYQRQRSSDETLPWSHLDFGVNKKFLRGELTKSGAAVFTPDCRKGKCVGCGVCDFKRVRMRLYDPAGMELPIHISGEGSFPAQPAGEAKRIRLRFSKTGKMSLLSHLELLSLFTRAVRRGGIPIIFSQGFHPHPKFSFATALPVGVESLAEYFDMEVDDSSDTEIIKERLNAVLPSGMHVMEAVTIPMSAPSLSVIMDSVVYRITLPDKILLDLQSRVEQFMGMESFPFRREKKGKAVDLDLREGVVKLTALGHILEMIVRHGRPLEIAEAVTGLKPSALVGARIEKLEVIFKDLSF